MYMSYGAEYMHTESFRIFIGYRTKKTVFFVCVCRCVQLMQTHHMSCLCVCVYVCVCVYDEYIVSVSFWFWILTFECVLRIHFLPHWYRVLHMMCANYRSLYIPWPLLFFVCGVLCVLVFNIYNFRFNVFAAGKSRL